MYDAIIFGGSSGIGLSTAIQLKNEGLSVLAVSRNAENNSLLNHNLIHGKNLDIAYYEELLQLFSKEVATKYIIATPSSPLLFDKIENISLHEAKMSFEKFWNYFSLIKLAAKTLKKLESITLVTGAIAKKNIAGTLLPKITNNAINEMVKTLAVELAPLRINAVSPGVTNTPLYDNFENKDQMLQKIANATPLQRIADPIEIAEAILLVVKNKNMTGTIIDCDSGASLTD